MKPAYVRGLGLWTPGFASPEAWCRGASNPSVVTPEVDLLSGALQAIGDDEWGYREEFIDLVRQARELSR